MSPSKRPASKRTVLVTGCSDSGLGASLATALFSDSQRLELAPFGVTVVDLKTGGASIPEKSIYQPAKDAVEKAMKGEDYMATNGPAEEWARLVVKDLLKRSPPSNIWRGTDAWLAWFSTLLPHGALDSTIKKMSGVDVVEKNIAK